MRVEKADDKQLIQAQRITDDMPAMSPELLARLFDICLSLTSKASVMQAFSSCWLLRMALLPLMMPLSLHLCANYF